MKFKSGDVVVLKSGGPKMTVLYGQKWKGQDEDIQEYSCTWFSKNQQGLYDGRPQICTFIELALELV